MRLSVLVLFLSLGSAALCQSSPPAARPDAMAGGCQSSSGQNLSGLAPREGWMGVPDCGSGRLWSRMMPKVPPMRLKSRELLGRLDPKFAVPFVPHIDPKIALPFTAEIDPKFVMRPPQSSIGALQPGTPVAPKLYPDLKLQLIRDGAKNSAK